MRLSACCSWLVWSSALCACAGTAMHTQQPATVQASARATPAAQPAAAGPAAAPPAAPSSAGAAAAPAAAASDGLAVTTGAVPMVSDKAPVTGKAVSAGSPALPVEPALAPEINAGVIARSALKAVLAQGIGRFLRSVRAEPDVIKGRFAGWRLTSLFADAPDVHVQVLRPGDTVRRANGQSIEHPEDFKTVWDNLATASELVLDIERAGKPSKLRYAIAD